MHWSGARHHDYDQLKFLDKHQRHRKTFTKRKKQNTKLNRTPHPLIFLIFFSVSLIVERPTLPSRPCLFTIADEEGGAGAGLACLQSWSVPNEKSVENFEKKNTFLVQSFFWGRRLKCKIPICINRLSEDNNEHYIYVYLGFILGAKKWKQSQFINHCVFHLHFQ